MKDEKWMMKVETWRMKVKRWRKNVERWRIKVEGGFEDKRTFVIVSRFCNWKGDVLFLALTLCFVNPDEFSNFSRILW